MNGKRAIKKNERNHPVKKSIRLVKDKIRKQDEKDAKDQQDN